MLEIVEKFGPYLGALIVLASALAYLHKQQTKQSESEREFMREQVKLAQGHVLASQQHVEKITGDFATMIAEERRSRERHDEGVQNALGKLADSIDRIKR